MTSGPSTLPRNSARRAAYSSLGWRKRALARQQAHAIPSSARPSRRSQSEEIVLEWVTFKSTVIIAGSAAWKEPLLRPWLKFAPLEQGAAEASRLIPRESPGRRRSRPRAARQRVHPWRRTSGDPHRSARSTSLRYRGIPKRTEEGRELSRSSRFERYTQPRRQNKSQVALRGTASARRACGTFSSPPRRYVSRRPRLYIWVCARIPISHRRSPQLPQRRS